jgi:hypothetical protein
MACRYQVRPGYVDHQAFAPDPRLLRHFIEQARGWTGDIGALIRRLKDELAGEIEVGGQDLAHNEDHPEWTPEEREFAAAWRKQQKWVVSRSLKSRACKTRGGLTSFAARFTRPVSAHGVVPTLRHRRLRYTLGAVRLWLTAWTML